MFEKRYASSKHVLYSLFFILGFIFIFIFAMFKLDDYRYVKYRISFTVSVNGLRVGSQIFYKGVQVGIVDDIQVELPNADLVNVLVKINKTMPIYEGFVATIGYQGITGYSVIDLSNKGITKEKLLPGSFIKSEASVVDNLYVFLPNLLDSCAKVVQKLNKFIDEEKSMINSFEKLKESLAGFDLLIKNANSSFSNVDVAFSSIQKATADFSILINELNKDRENLKKEQISKLDEILQSVEVITKEIKDKKRSLVSVF